MHWLSVTLRYHDAVVEQRLCEVQETLVLGEAPDAVVSFPGCHLLVRRIGDRLQVAGRWLDPGQRIDIRKPPLEVTIEAVPARPRAISLAPIPDPRMLVLSGAIVLFGAWLETTWRVFEANPTAVSLVQASVRGWAEPASTEAGPRVTVAQPGGAMGAAGDPERQADEAAVSPQEPYGEEIRWPAARYQESH